MIGELHPVPGWLVGSGGAGVKQKKWVKERKGVGAHRTNSTAKCLKMEMALEPQAHSRHVGTLG